MDRLDKKKSRAERVVDGQVDPWGMNPKFGKHFSIAAASCACGAHTQCRMSIGQTGQMFNYRAIQLNGKIN